MDNTGTPENTTLFTRTENNSSESKDLKILVKDVVQSQPSRLDLAKYRPQLWASRAQYHGLPRWCPGQQATAGGPSLPDISVIYHMLLLVLQSHSLDILQGKLRRPC